MNRFWKMRGLSLFTTKPSDFSKTEIQKACYWDLQSLSAWIMTELFEPRNNHYNLRHVPQINTPSMNTMYRGIDSLSFSGPKTWNLLPNELKNIKSFKAFKNRIENWTADKCPCRIFKVYISNVDFIWKKMPGSSLSKALRFHVFFGYFIINFYLALFDFNLLFMTLVSTLLWHSFSRIHSPLAKC